MNTFTLLQRKHVYSGPIFDVYSDDIQAQNGDIIHRDVVEHKDASAIVAVTDSGNILFVRQYRHPAKQDILEIPAGILDEGETPVECALRELEEETGFKASKIELLTKFYSSIGFCTEMIYVYAATGLSLGNQHLDFDEHVTLEEYSLDDAVKMVFDGRITDSKTITALLAYKETLSRLA